jgi:peptide/nickel transport system ATP-binding protein
VSLLDIRGLVVDALVDGEWAPMFRGLNLSLAPGRVMGIVGESGAGKSMIGRAIGHALPPGFAIRHGTILFDGHDLLAMPDRARRDLLGRDIAFIPQDPRAALDPAATVGAHLDEHHRRLGVRGRASLREQARAALASVGVADPDALRDRYPHELSPGACQLVQIAMAFAGGPRLLVADEPTSAVDVATQARIMALMRALQQVHGTAVLFITHDLRLAASVCDEVAVLYAGDVVETGPAAEVFGRARHPYTRCLQLASPPMDGARRGLYVMQDAMPGLRAIARLDGCRFAPRCPVKAEYCLRTDPPLEGGTHRAACIRPALAPTIAPPPPPAPPPWRPVGEAPVLVMEGASKRYPGGAQAVREASLRIAPGEFVGLVGESGSGKTTLARLILGLEQADAGRILVAGQDVAEGGETARLHRVANVQMVFADPETALNPHRRVAEVITQALEAQQAPWRVREKRARELLAEMDMPLALGVRRPAQLSRSQRQRANLARALCIRPRLLVADELVSGLDVPLQSQLLNLLHRLRQDSEFAMLFITHDLSVVRHLCDRVLVMHQGVVVEDGPTETVFGWPRVEQTRALIAATPRG